MAERKKQHLAVIVGANITSRRLALGISQKDFAKRMGMGADSLSRIEGGFVAPRFGRLEKFAQELQCSVAELFVDNTRLAGPFAQRDEVLQLTERITTLLKQLPDKPQPGVRIRRARARAVAS